MLKKNDIVMLVPIPEGGVIRDEMKYSSAGQTAIVLAISYFGRDNYTIELQDGEDYSLSYNEAELFKVGEL